MLVLISLRATKIALASQIDNHMIISVIRVLGFKLKSLILAQIERWRNALHMQVER